MPADGATPVRSTERLAVLTATICEALDHVGREPMAPESVVAAAEHLAGCPDLDRAIQATGWGIKQNAAPGHDVLLAYQAALEERASPTLWAARLRREEESLRAASAKELEAAADAWGKVNYRGFSDEEKAGWERAARAGEARAELLVDQAAEKAGAAAAIERRLAQASSLFDVVADRRPAKAGEVVSLRRPRTAQAEQVA